MRGLIKRLKIDLDMPLEEYQNCGVQRRVGASKRESESRGAL